MKYWLRKLAIKWFEIEEMPYDYGWITDGKTLPEVLKVVRVGIENGNFTYAVNGYHDGECWRHYGDHKECDTPRGVKAVRWRPLLPKDFVNGNR